MTPWEDFVSALGAIHFLRPLWLLAMPALVPIWWAQRRQGDARRVWQGLIEPHLLDALLIDTPRRQRFAPLHLVVALVVLLSLAAAGPAWQRQGGPAEARPPLVIALSLAPGMLAADVAPSRLAAAREQIRAIVRARPGARHALVVYAGNANVVVPMSDDPRLIDFYLDDLAPGLMPRQGSRPELAAQAAARLLVGEQAPGALLFLGSGLGETDAAALRKASGNIPALMLGIGARGGVDDFDPGATHTTAVAAGVTDLGSMHGAVRTGAVLAALRAISNKDSRMDAERPWEDMSYLMLIPTILLGVLWFRRGWRLHWDE